MIGVISTAMVAAVLNLAALLNYFTYAQWAKLSPEGRAAYIAGTFDSLVNRYDDDAERRRPRIRRSLDHYLHPKKSARFDY
jgi:hypothetical protein